MAEFTGNSLTIETTDLAAYGLCVVGGSLPLIAPPVTNTVNLPGMVGGYSYQNLPDAGVLTLQCYCVGSSTSDLAANLQDIFALMPITEEVDILPDIYPELYWVGRRTSGIIALPFGAKAVEFELTFTCDDPRALSRDTDNPLEDLD